MKWFWVQNMLINYLRSARRIATILFTRSAYGRQYLLRRALKSSQRHTHPIDVTYSIQTSGFIPNFLSDPGVNIAKIVSRENNHYAGCQPSCLRKALRSLPDTNKFAFYDLGCGMGRALVVASEFPFREIVGVDLSKELCAIATKNAQKIAQSFPDRAQISVEQGDATAIALGGDRIVVFMYHSFGRTTLTPIINRLEQLVKAGRDVFIIFENPVNGDLVEQSIYFSRWYAEQVPGDSDEIGHHSDVDDGVVVWRSVNAMPAQRSGHQDFKIVITKPTWRAEVVRSDR
ncbi:class I SAM-dependent methyltransferase [Methylobacterium sp. J-088]|uniref:class I SAM-dependent methyltransferase n=1 Tax=Methylobacterium sp. J-088 TaxID=2836664 RepID=UPI001FB95916|nr:class I SAM-dependent methyltransferase [Methylobacterium sp. J-088]MCJ2067057.1 class I SAM-dependent methyltransferase [Methylobacterium sp. J-088]